jgi:hypothetical protein
MAHHHYHKEPLWKELWRPLAAFVYLAICILDFGIMPIIYEMINQSISNQSLVDLALKFTDSAAQIEALHTLRQARVWVPLTLQGNGMFHIAFGAILGVSAWTRGQEKAMMSFGGYNSFGGNFGAGNFGSFNNFPTQQYNSASNFGGLNNGNQYNGQQHQFTPMSGVQNVQQPAPVKTNAVSVSPKFDIVNPDDANE